ncbi:alpha/beta-hydrolase [Penicillium soppii]|jgi:pimeloyl-ACP methyl ester carboxylesterase|uniref:alpha/beta-hydrolase n=1 Tax=Penicillium soppii TaxID=69789 RepID=UPI002546A8CD|nr:alpha/beta-hydrolase [Penicillium soppii]KAJ5855335.1 alpha/beta-hydrolase [Penicillium soppii]
MLPQSGELKVNGATLYYETRGKPEYPALLLISTGNGTAVFFEPLALILSSNFYVITFDRRGFYRSTVMSHESFSGDILAKNAEDCACIIETLVPDRSAFVFSSSGSTTIALDLLWIKPHLVAKVVLHEPILTAMLSSSDRIGLDDLLTKTTRTYQKSGSAAANRLLMPALSSIADIALLKTAPILKKLVSLPHSPTNVYFEHEIEAISQYHLDLESLQARKDQICLGRGDMSSSPLAISPVTRLSSLLNSNLNTFPGGHHGYITHERSFCEKLAHVLKDRKEGL